MKKKFSVPAIEILKIEQMDSICTNSIADPTPENTPQPGSGKTNVMYGRSGFSFDSDLY